MLLRFIRDESGQDLIEYSLLITLITLGVVELFLNTGASLRPVWGTASVQLLNAAASAS